MWNKYKFLRELEEEINNLEQDEDIHDYIHYQLNNAVIYYSDCWDICRELHATHFEDDLFGMPTNITQHAYNSLYEYVYDNLEL